MFLLDSVVFTFCDLPQSKRFFIKLEPRLGVVDDDRGVVNAEKQFCCGRSMPLRITFAGREPEDFEGVMVRILEVKRLYARCIRVPFGQCLRSCGCILDFVLSQLLICPVHIRHDDRDVLEPAIVASRVGGDRPAFRRQIFRQFDRLISELNADDSCAHSE